MERRLEAKQDAAHQKQAGNEAGGGAGPPMSRRAGGGQRGRWRDGNSDGEMQGSRSSPESAGASQRRASEVPWLFILFSQIVGCKVEREGLGDGLSATRLEA